MALIERLMKLEAPAIPVHSFFAAQQEILSGRLTQEAMLSALMGGGGRNMTMN